MAALNTKASKE